MPFELVVFCEVENMNFSSQMRHVPNRRIGWFCLQNMTVLTHFSSSPGPVSWSGPLISHLNSGRIFLIGLQVSTPVSFMQFILQARRVFKRKNAKLDYIIFILKTL